MESISIINNHTCSLYSWLLIFSLLLSSEAFLAFQKIKHMAAASCVLMCVINYSGSFIDFICCTLFSFWGMKAFTGALVLWLPKNVVLWHPFSTGWFAQVWDIWGAKGMRACWPAVNTEVVWGQSKTEWWGSTSGAGKKAQNLVLVTWLTLNTSINIWMVKLHCSGFWCQYFLRLDTSGKADAYSCPEML